MGWFKDKLGFDIPLITGSGSVTDALFGESGSPGLFSNPSGAWDEFKNGKTNTTNQAVAEQNLAFQKERANIEDQRYAEETAYNRTWAEDERQYNRALQQEIFNREDTALTRQAEQLSALGINPASQQLNGLGAGAQVSSAAAPSASGRMAETPQNSFRMQDQGMLPILSSMLSIADTVNGVKTGQYQRDALALQNDKQFLENLRLANGLGIKYNGLFDPESSGGYRNFKKQNYRLDYADPSIGSLFESYNYKSASGSEWRKMRKDSMPSWQYTLDSLGQDDVYNQAEKALTRGAKLFDKVFDSSEHAKEWNPFNKLLNLFW